MARFCTELYDALRDAGASDTPARKAAEAVAHLATRPTRTWLDLGWGLHDAPAERDPPTWLDLGRGVQALLWLTGGVLLGWLLLAGGH